MNRGDVYRLRPPRGAGHEQDGPRFGVIVQADELLRLSRVIVAPTSRSARPSTFRPVIEVAGQPTRVLVEQLSAVDTGRLGSRVGHLSAEESWSVDEAVRFILGV